MDSLPQPRSLGQPIEFHRIGSDPFEYLSRDLIRDEPYVKRAFKYGTRGVKQYGIDIFAITKDGNGIVVGQAKAYKNVKKKDIETAVNTFIENLEYWKRENTKYFILTYGCEITDRDAEEYIREQYDWFAVQGIEFDVWDSNEIERKISKSKSCELIFRKYFQEVAELYIKQYCAIIPKLAIIQRQKYLHIEQHIDRIVSRQKKEDKLVSQAIIESFELFEVVEEETRVLLLADAGIGKTQELQNLYNRVYKESSYTPVLIPLINYTDKDIEYYLSGEELENQEQLIILFDGLDEIKPDYKGIFLRKLEEFSSISLSRIVLTCRTNHFEGLQVSSSSEMSGFQIFYLNKLNTDQLVGYLNTVNHNLNKELLKLKNREFLQLLESPFYLKKITTYYQENNRLPENNKLLFIFLIDSKINQYFKKKGFEIQSRDKEILKDDIIRIAKNVALSLELTGKNYCESQSINEIVTDKELELLVAAGILQVDMEEGILRFEHRQIQEFFAALALSNSGLKIIKTFISIPPSFREILPSWYNTIGMLLTLIEETSEVYTDLINYLLDKNTEVFIYLERDRLTEDLSLKIFKSMVDQAKRKGIGLSISFYEIDKLSKLTEYRSVQEYIIEELSQEWKESSLIADLLTITEYTTFLNTEWRRKIYEILLEKIQNENTQEVLIWKSIYTISGLGFADRNSIKGIIDKLGDNESDSIRSSIYKLIEESGNQLHFKEYVVSELKRYSKSKTKRLLSGNSSELLDVSFNLSSLILNIEDTVNYIGYVEFLSKNMKIVNELVHDFLPKLIEKGVPHFEKNKDVFGAIISLYIGFANSHLTGIKKEFISFFERTNTKHEALIAILEQRDSFKIFSAWHIVPFIEMSSIDYLLKHFSEKRKGDINIILGVLDGVKENFGESVSLSLKENLEEKREDILERPDIIDWNTRRADESKRTIEIIFNKEEFLEEIDNVFDLLGDVSEEEIKSKDIYREAYYKHDIIFPRIVLDFVRAYFDDEIYDKDKIKSEFKVRDWNKWVSWKFYDSYVNGKINEEGIQKIQQLLTDQQIEVIKEWCIDQFPDCDFKKAMQIKEDGYSTILVYPVLIWMYQRIFEIQFDNNVVKDMIAFDYYDVDKRELSYYETYLSVDEILQEVVSNLEEGVKDTFVVKKHLNYLYEKENAQLHYFLEKYFLASESNDALRSHCLELLLKSRRGLDIAVKSLENIQGEFYWRAIDRVTNVEKMEKVENLLIERLNESENEKERINASVRLMRFSNIEGLKYYISKAKEKKKFPEYEYMYTEAHFESPISLYRDIEGLPVLLDLLSMEYDEEFKTKRFKNVAGVVIGALKKIALSSYSNFEDVYSKLEDFIEANVDKNIQVKNLYWSLDSISKEFYLNYSKSIPLKEAAERVKNLIN